MRIAMIGSRGIGSNYGGIERCLDELAPRLCALGHQVDVFSEGPPRGPLPAGLRAIPVGQVGGKHFGNLSRSTLSTLRALGHYDVLHFHAIGPGVLSALTAAAGQPSVVTVHALDQQRDKWGWAARQALKLAQSTVMACATEVTVVSESLRRYVRERYDITATRLLNGLTPKPWRPPGALLARHGLTPRGYLLFAARLTPEKGAHDLIAAFNRSRVPYKLAIAGGNGPDDYLARLRAEADPGRVVFLGHLGGDDLAEAFCHAHSFVLPSYIEGMSIALLEAIACRLPVLVSDIPENALVVRKPECVFPVGNVEALSAAIDASLSPAITAARRVPEDRFQSWEAIAAGYERVYRRAAQRRGARPHAADDTALPTASQR